MQYECGYCGAIFAAAARPGKCAGCPLHDCGKTKCPYCGKETASPLWKVTGPARKQKPRRPRDPDCPTAGEKEN